jgi:amino acid transporter
LERSRGPTDQLKRIERRLFVSLLISIIIVSAAIFVNYSGVLMSERQITVPVNEGGVDSQEIDNPFDANSTVGAFGIIIGVFLNFMSINKYTSDYEDIERDLEDLGDQENVRPKSQLRILGIVVTVLTVGIAYVLMFV